MYCRFFPRKCLQKAVFSTAIQKTGNMQKEPWIITFISLLQEMLPTEMQGTSMKQQKNMPMDRMLIESESPFMVPSYYKGKRNKPAYLHSTSEFIAELRGLSLEETAEILYQNSLDFFNITE
eukprot:Anaeramoba_ignava/a378773_2.p1 GENE.a378773_2~~a378773_2.p1  ORF type:complete len:122 (+),score=14.10 a378773_2:44-409(+)